MSKYYSSSIAFGAKQTKTEKVVVSPTKIGDVTTDAVSGALTVDEVPTLNSLNPVSSDGVARAVIQAGAELPTRGSSDTGKVLTVKNSAGDLEWDAPSGGLPNMAGQDGKILGAVDNGGTMEAQWISKPVSNVTTKMGEFNVGVNGSGVPVKVNAKYATPNGDPVPTSFQQTATYTDSYNTYVSVGFDLGENVTVDGSSWSNPKLSIPSTVSVTIPSDTNLNVWKMQFVQFAPSGDTEYMYTNGFYLDWNASSPFSVTTDGSTTTLTITAGDYEFKKQYPKDWNYISLGLYMRFSSAITDETKTQLSNAVASWKVKSGSYGGFKSITSFGLTPAQLPTYSQSDAGRSLTVDSSGTLQWAQTIPSIANNAGKVLAVNSGATGVEWINNVPIEVVASMPATPTAGTLYIVTGA